MTRKENIFFLPFWKDIVCPTRKWWWFLCECFRWWQTWTSFVWGEHGFRCLRHPAAPLDPVAQAQVVGKQADRLRPLLSRRTNQLPHQLPASPVPLQVHLLTNMGAKRQVCFKQTQHNSFCLLIKTNGTFKWCYFSVTGSHMTWYLFFCVNWPALQWWTVPPTQPPRTLLRYDH